MKNNKSNSDNVFSSITRKIVKEELIPVKKDIKSVRNEFKIQLEETRKKLDAKWDFRFFQFEQRMDQKLDDTYRRFRDEIMVGIDQIAGMFKKNEEEHEILRVDHARIIKIEEYLKI